MLLLKFLIVTCLSIYRSIQEEGVDNGNELLRKILQNSALINSFMEETIKTSGKEAFMSVLKQNPIPTKPVPAKVLRCIDSLSYTYKNILSMWAAEMFDSYGKPPSGLLLVRAYWPGNLDECLRVRAPESPRYPLGFKGRYCRLKKTIVKDPTMLFIGICVPDTCTADELQHSYTTNLLKTFLKESKILNGISNIPLVFTLGISNIPALPLLKDIPGNLPKELASNMLMDIFSSFDIACHPGAEPWASSTIIYMLLLMILFGILIIGTLAGLKPKKFVTLDGQHSTEGHATFKVRELLRCFSVLENGRTILNNTTNNKEQLYCIHGIRTITMFWVVLGHSVSIFIPITDNLLDLIVESFTLKFVVIFQGFYAVDTFFLLSGFLLSYLFLKEPMRVTKTHVCILYLRRFIRLTPSYMMIIFSMYSLENVFGIESIHWERFNTLKQNCYHSWWKNLLYISNFKNINEQCLGWGWFLSCDMQFFLISPIFLMYLKSSKKSERKIGFIICFSILTTSWLATAYVTWKNNLPGGFVFDRHNISGFLVDPSTIERYALYSKRVYINPLMRIQPHTIGCLLGYILFHYKSARLTLKRSYIYLGWTLSCCTMVFIIYYLYWLHLGPAINILHSTFSKTVWAISVSWVIFACSTGIGGPVDTFLSWEAWRPFSRLTFGAYLLHPLIMIYFYISYSSLIHFSYGTMIIYYLGFICLTYISSFITTISFEVPIAKMEKLFIKPITVVNAHTKNDPANDIVLRVASYNQHRNLDQVVQTYKMHIRTCLVTMPPFAFPTSNPEAPFVGPLITMFENIAARTNITYNLGVATDQCTVSMRYPNGSWTGCRGMMQRNETDLLLGPELMTAEDLDDIRIGSHYYFIAIQFLASAGYAEGMDFSKFFLAFDVELWYFLLVGIITLTLIVTSVETIDSKLVRREINAKPIRSETNFWMFLATLFLEGTPRVPPLHKTRLIFGTWILMVLVLMSAFSSQLKTALMLKGQDDTMRNLNDLANRPEVTVYTRKSGVLEESLKSSSMEIFQRIWKNVVNQNRYGLRANDYFLQREVYDIVKSGKGVLMGASCINKWVVAHHCPTMVGNRWFYFIPGSEFTNILRIYAPNSFPSHLFDKMNKLILYLSESAIFDKWIDDANEDFYRKCLTSDFIGKENTETSSLSFEHLLPMVYITISLQVFSFCVLLSEIAYFKIINRIYKS